MNEEQIRKIVSEVVNETLFPLLGKKMTYKQDMAITRLSQNVEAIRLYPKEFGEVNVNSTTERGETPSLGIKLTMRKSTGKNEIDFQFFGERHTESLSYYTKPRDQWQGWGEIVMSLEQAEVIGLFLVNQVAMMKTFNRLKGREGIE